MPCSTSGDDLNIVFTEGADIVSGDLIVNYAPGGVAADLSSWTARWTFRAAHGEGAGDLELSSAGGSLLLDAAGNIRPIITSAQLYALYDAGRGGVHTLVLYDLSSKARPVVAGRYTIDPSAVQVLP